MINFKAVGFRIKQARRDKGLTQECLAETVGVATEYMSRVETGASRPSLVLIERIASVLEVDESELLFGGTAEKIESKSLMEKIAMMEPGRREIANQIIELISKL